MERDIHYAAARGRTERSAIQLAAALHDCAHRILPPETVWIKSNVYNYTNVVFDTPRTYESVLTHLYASGRKIRKIYILKIMTKREHIH